MKEIKKKGMSGKTVTILKPENEADAKKLAEMVVKGEVDGRISFGDARRERDRAERS